MSKHQQDPYDAVVIGGAFSGSSVAILLRRWNPGARILVVERAGSFDRKVGEATVEISAFFLHRVLGLHDLLAREHLPKHGLRYWFHGGDDSGLEEMSEVGPSEVPRLPAYQLDRSRLDESLLEIARREGIEVLRPARITGVDLDRPVSTVEIAPAEGPKREVGARWVLDGSGRHAFLARRLRLRRRIEEHPTAAAWGRWRGVADFDGSEILGSDPRSPRLDPIPPARGLATNHFCGYGYWIWTIPLSDGATSVGVVWNKRLFELPAGESLEDRYRRFVLEQPGIRELLAPAELEPGDFRAYSHLPYTAERYMDRGWALLGDAASFLDPYYSAGLDHASMSVYATARIVSRELEGGLDEEELGERIREHNDRFRRSYDRWLSAIYLGKYELLGDAELTGASFLMDTALYYLGIVSPVYESVDELQVPVYGKKIPATGLAYRLMRFYNRRLLRLARHRRRRGTYGARNHGSRILEPAAGLGVAGAWPMLWAGLKLWIRAELLRWLPRRARPARSEERPPRRQVPAPS